VRPSSFRFGTAAATAAIAFSCALWAPSAQATLGSNAASVDANQHALVATRQIVKLPSGERHDLALPSGVIVREYVAPGGAVYAVSWSGPRMPDLHEILGPYFAQLGAHASHGGHHRMNLAGQDFVVRSSGHGHAFSGRAWVPSLVPAGVDLAATFE
jgi:hypothetical protein